MWKCFFFLFAARFGSSANRYPCSDGLVLSCLEKPAHAQKLLGPVEGGRPASVAPRRQHHAGDNQPRIEAATERAPSHHRRGLLIGPDGNRWSAPGRRRHAPSPRLRECIRAIQAQSHPRSVPSRALVAASIVSGQRIFDCSPLGLVPLLGMSHNDGRPLEQTSCRCYPAMKIGT